MSGDRRQDAGEGQIGCVTDTTSAARLDDDSTVELTGAAGRTVFGIRAGIIKDRAALKGLQEHVLRVCQRPTFAVVKINMPSRDV